MTNKTRIACLLTLLSAITLGSCVAPVLVVGGAGATAVTDRRTAQAMATDGKIELAIGKAIYTNEQLKLTVHINVTSYDGVVLLSGEALDASARNLIIELARPIANIKRIHNEIVIGPTTTLQTRSHDTMITAKVKGLLLRAKEVNPIHIKVVTENQTVYLMGLVYKEESRVATLLARRTKGVKEVVTLFNILD